MTGLTEWTCEGDPKAADLQVIRRQREASPLSGGHVSAGAWASEL